VCIFFDDSGDKQAFFYSIKRLVFLVQVHYVLYEVKPVSVYIMYLPFSPERVNMTVTKFVI
jgi:hypothetical protein